MGFKTNTPNNPLSVKEFAMFPAELTTEKTPESFSAADMALYLRAYLAKVDISIDVADPELYNRCINTAIKEKAEYLEEDNELEPLGVGYLLKIPDVSRNSLDSRLKKSKKTSKPKKSHMSTNQVDRFRRNKGFW